MDEPIPVGIDSLEQCAEFLDREHGPDGVGAGVFPSFGRVIRGLLTMMAAGLVATAFGVVGIVFAVRHRRSLERASNGPDRPVAPLSVLPLESSRNGRESVHHKRIANRREAFTRTN